MQTGDAMLKLFWVTLLWAVGVASVGGCASTHSDDAWQAGPPTRARYRVFEVAADDADTVVAHQSRHQVAQSPYEVALISRDTLDKLTRLTREDSGSLVEHSIFVNQWPRVADSWSYSRANQKVLGSGGAAGFLGVRGTEQSRELRVEYNVTHGINRAGPVDPASRIEAPIFYEGAVRDDQALVFVAPLRRTDGQQVAHVIAFSFDHAQ
jgi:hypothetical protein